VTRAREAAARPARGQGGRATAARTTPGRLAPLVTPAAGSLVEAFGVQRAPGLRSDTVTWSTRRRAQVVAPAGGEVAFAAPWRNFAQVLIIRVDADYAVVLTGMETLSVREGQSVRAGQPVGAMPDRTSPAPRLALQLRRDGNAIDPGPWLRR
jgi:septal ring factor EnvC (AmiA/AmiB activator)